MYSFLHQFFGQQYMCRLRTKGQNVFHATNVTQESCFVWIKWEKEKTVIGLSVQPSYFNQSNFETFLFSSTFLIFS